MYGLSNRGEYLTVGGGLDLTTWVWNAEQEPEQTDGTQPSFKLLYRYTDALYIDDLEGSVHDTNHLWAMMFQRKF
jgi:hypothetical protein